MRTFMPVTFPRRLAADPCRLETNPRRSERLDVGVGLCPMAPLRLSPFDRRARYRPSPLPLAAIIEHAVCAECPDRTLVQLGLIRPHDEQSALTRLRQIAGPVAQIRRTGFSRTPRQPSGNCNQDCRSNDHDATSTNPMVP